MISRDRGEDRNVPIKRQQKQRLITDPAFGGVLGSTVTVVPGFWNL
jgi:hypothetical protein